MLTELQEPRRSRERKKTARRHLLCLAVALAAQSFKKLFSDLHHLEFKCLLMFSTSRSLTELPETECSDTQELLVGHYALTVVCIYFRFFHIDPSTLLLCELKYDIHDYYCCFCYLNHHATLIQWYVVRLCLIFLPDIRLLP